MRSIALISLLSVLSACSGRTSDTPTRGDLADATPNYDPSIISVPFLVDDHFIPSGCMGDCTASVSIDGDCPERSSAGAQGQCHHFVYTLNTAPGALGWAGVLWQTVEQNWGSEPGRTIAPGATQLTFSGKAVGSSAALNILVGALSPDDAGKACKMASGCASLSCVDGACAAPHRDTLDLTQSEVLTSTAWTPFQISFGNASYGSELMSGFGWTAVMPPQTTKIEFYVDDLRWE